MRVAHEDRTLVGEPGSCDMPLYEPLCNRVEVVRSVDQLAGVAEELVKSRF